MHLKTGVTAITLALAFAGMVVAFSFFYGTAEPAAAVKSATEPATGPLVRSDPGIDPRKEERVALPTAQEDPEPERQPAPAPEPAPEPRPEPRPEPTPPPDPPPEPEPSPQPEPEPVVGEPPEPTDEEISLAHRPRHYELPDDAILGLTVEAIGIHDVPVFDSVGASALKHGVGHHPETSMPWTDAAQRNVYLAGHKLGFPGTDSHLVFYRLDELGDGDEILLRDRDGKRYRYRVTETFKATPEDSWVMGQVRDRDMVTLQTCSGPDWKRRLIVRADRY